MSSSGFIITPFAYELSWLTTLIREVGADSDVGVEFTRADDIFAPGVIIDQVLDAIDAADVIIAVTTGRNANVFFELGWAWRRHRPLLIAEGAGDLPFDVAGWRHLLYGEGYPCHDREELRRQLSEGIRHVLHNRELPTGQVVYQAPRRRRRARVAASLDRQGRTTRLILHNGGNVDVKNVNVDIPDEVGSFSLMGSDLPIDVLRPGERVPLLASTHMGGGPRIFDVTVTGETDDGPQEWPSKIAL